MDISILKNTMLYAEYIAREGSIRGLEVKIGIDDLKTALDSTYPYMTDSDSNFTDIEKIVKYLNIEKKEAIRFGYRKIVQKIDKIKEQKRIELSDKLIEMFETLNLNKNRFEDFIKIETVEKSIFSFKIAKDIKKALSNNIFGQDKAIDIISDAFKDNLLENDKLPKNIFFFLGPSGTGKTFLAKNIATLFPDYVYKEYNMTQYTYSETAMNLVGNHKMWGNAQNGELTSFVKKNPKSIIVFDEFDKGHTNVQNILLTVLNDGYLEDALGWCSDGTPYHRDKIDESECKEIDTLVNFNETILIFTTNLGSTFYNDSRFMDNFSDNYIYSQQILFDVLSQETKQETIKAGSKSNSDDAKAILPHFLSRLMQSKLVLFNKLTLIDYVNIAEKKFLEFKEKILNKYKINISCDDEDLYYLFIFLVLQQSPSIDARNVNSKSIDNLYYDILEHLELYDMDIKDFNSISITISNEAKKYFDKNFKELYDKNSLIKYFFRKNLAFKINSKVDISKKSFNYEITSIEHHKINSVSDFQGEDALVFEVPDISFDQIAGHDSIKSRLKEIVQYLKDPKLLDEYQIDTPRGMLMYGKPGTGKTMLARAFANEADLPIIQTTGSKLFNEEHLKSIYKKAKEYSPSIIFIDEIDALGKRDGNTYKDMLINHFLTELNGFGDDKEQLVFTIAATNFKDKIDAAILRSGRIDLHIEIDELDKKAREFFINKLLKKPNDGTIEKEKILFYTAGMTGADLEKVLRESSLESLRRKNKLISQDIIIEQINIIKYGHKRLDKSIDLILEETAYHEAGHAVVSNILMPHIPIEQITITPREKSLGFVSYNTEEYNANESKEDLENRISVLFAGRIAQTKKFGAKGIDTGATNDLEKATKIAYIMVAHYGMDDELGYINIDGIPNLQYFKENISDTTFLQSDIEKRIKVILKNIEIKTKELIDKNWKKIDNIAKILIKKEVLEYDDIKELFYKDENL